jgi:hypothetical protein
MIDINLDFNCNKYKNNISLYNYNFTKPIPKNNYNNTDIFFSLNYAN